MSENQAVKAKNIIARRYTIWGAVFIALFTSISLIWLFLRFLNLDAYTSLSHPKDISSDAEIRYPPG